MAAPVAVARTTPVGVWVHDGFRVKLTFGNNPALPIFETALTPAGTDMGEPIPQDHMWVTRWRILRERQLISLTPATLKGKYDPAFKAWLDALTGVNQTITEYVYDGSSAAYFGIPKSFAFDEHVEGQPGHFTCVIVPSNWDPTNRVYAAPVFASVSGS